MTPDHRLLHIHIRRTAGTTFVAALRSALGDDVWPAWPDRAARSAVVTTSDSLSSEQAGSALAISVRAPLAVVDALGPDVAAVTMLRHPVYRTISTLRWCGRHVARFDGWSLEEIYEDDEVQATLIHEHQTRMLSMTAAECATAAADGSGAAVIDAGRRMIARQNLDSCAVVGVTNAYGDFVDDVNEAFGLTLPRGGRLEASPPSPPVPDAFKRRIEADNPSDTELYALAAEGSRRRHPSGPVRARDDAPSPSHLLFIHIMKTAGTTFTTALRNELDPASVFPRHSGVAFGSIYEKVALSALEQSRRDFWAVRPAIYSAHVPFVAREVLTDADTDTAFEQSRRNFWAERPAIDSADAPFVAREVLTDTDTAAAHDPPLGCLVLLREPIARTMSFLQHARRAHEALRDEPLEAIYDIPWLFDRLIHDHQVRVLSIRREEAEASTGFAELLEEMALDLLPDDATRARGQLSEHMRAGDPDAAEAVLVANHVDEPDLVRLTERVSDALGHGPVAVPYLVANASMARPSPVDHGRLQDALTNLTRCAVVGLTSDYPGFVADVNRVVGLDCDAGGWLNRSDPLVDEPPRAFLRRIEEDNRLDLELYAAAADLVAYRRGN